MTLFVWLVLLRLALANPCTSLLHYVDCIDVLFFVRCVGVCVLVNPAI
jgi:hypothetical protein